MFFQKRNTPFPLKQEIIEKTEIHVEVHHLHPIAARFIFKNGWDEFHGHL